MWGVGFRTITRLQELTALNTRIRSMSRLPSDAEDRKAQDEGKASDEAVIEDLNRGFVELIRSRLLLR